MTTRPKSQCGACARYRSPFARPDGNWDGPAFCEAFPDGIPAEVFGNQLDHRQPIDGDHGVRWLSNGDDFPEYAFAPERLGVGRP